MRLLSRLSLLLLVLGTLGGGIALWAANGRKPPEYRHAEVTRGDVVMVVNATGTVQPVLSVSVGAFVSGPVEEVYVNFNNEVKDKHVLAKIDQRLFKANVAQADAALKTRVAEVARAKAQLAQAENDEERALRLRKQNKDFISDAEMDKAKYDHLALKAALEAAKAAVKQAQANLDNNLANLEYTVIRAPVAGTVINRKIDPGQTVAASFQTPELFVIAPNMKERMHIIAAVDEADIGRVKDAQARKLPVHFTVDAYQDDLFTGEIDDVRMNSTTTQNVVTYPVIVWCRNPDLKLMPGMTASLSFQVAEAKGVLRVPNAALRYFPRPEQVRPEDRGLLEGGHEESKDDADDAGARPAAGERAEARKGRNRRHVWVEDGEYLRAVEVEVGVGGTRHTQLVSGNLSEGQKLVTGVRTAP